MGRLVDPESGFQIDMSDACKKCKHSLHCWGTDYRCYPVTKYMEIDADKIGKDVEYTRKDGEKVTQWVSDSKHLCHYPEKKKADMTKEELEAGIRIRPRGPMFQTYSDISDSFDGGNALFDEDDFAISDDSSNAVKVLLLMTQHNFDSEAVAEIMSNAEKEWTRHDVTSTYHGAKTSLQKAFKLFNEKYVRAERIIRDDTLQLHDKAWVLAHIMKMKQDDIAELLEVSPSQAKRLVAKGVEHVRQELATAH